jgi:hypothetical protein
VQEKAVDADRRTGLELAPRAAVASCGLGAPDESAEPRCLMVGGATGSTSAWPNRSSPGYWTLNPGMKDRLRDLSTPGT